MGIASNVWDAATALMPAGGLINKMGRTAASYVSENPGIIGQVAKKVLPESWSNSISNVTDAVVKELPEGKVKGALASISNEMKGQAPVRQNVEQSSTDNHAFVPKYTPPNLIPNSMRQEAKFIGRTQPRRLQTAQRRKVKRMLYI
jgi:hypothetical protein